MASFYSDVATTYSTSLGIHERNSDSRLTSGDLKLLYATYTSVGTEVATDLIYMARCRAGQLFLPWAGGFIYQTGIASTTAGELGVLYDDSALTDDDDAFFASATITASTKTEYDGTLASSPTEILGDGWIVFNPGTLTTPAADKILLISIPYVQSL